MEYVVILCVILGTGGALWLGVHYGEKWIDRAFLANDLDPSKGISLPPLSDKQRREIMKS